MILYAGVDLGTGYSVSAVADEEGEYISRMRSEVLGIREFKRVFGMKKSNLQDAYTPYDTVEDKDGYCLITKTVSPDKVSVSPEDLMIQMLNRIDIPKDTRTVLTCPSHFTETQRRLLKSVGKLSHLDVVRVMSEPTAAAVGSDMKGVGVVVDVGSGTTDCSIVEIDDIVFEVLHSSGDMFLGGLDLDNKLGSEEEKLAIRTPNSEIDEFSCKVLRCIKKTFISAKMSYSDVEWILLCGGTCQGFIGECIRKTVISGLNVDEHIVKMACDPLHIIAKGALKICRSICEKSSEKGNILVLDCIHNSIGIRTFSGQHIIIPKGTKLPATAEENFKRAVDDVEGPAEVDVTVVEGDHPDMRLCEVLDKSTFLLDGILNIRVEVDVYCNITITSTEKKSGRESVRKVVFRSEKNGRTGA